MILRRKFTTVSAVGLFIFLIAFSGYSQSIPSLFEKIDQLSASDKESFDRLLQFTVEHRDVNREECLDYLEKIRVNAIRIRYGKALVGYAYQRLEIGLESSDFKTGYKDLQDLYEAHQDLLSDQEKASFLIYLSRFASNLYLTDETMEYLDKALEYDDKEPNLSLNRATRGIELFSQGKYDEATVQYFLALKYFESTKNFEEQAKINSNLGRLFKAIKDLQKSLFHYKKALYLTEQLNHEFGIAMLNSNLGTTYQSLDSNKLALEHYDMSLEFARRLGNSSLIAQNLLNKGNIYVKLGLFNDAEEGYQESLQICYKSGVEYGVLLNYLNLGILYLKKSEFQKSLVTSDSALFYAKKLKLPKEEMDVYVNLTDTYFKMGNYYEAYQSLKKKETLSNELLTQDKQKVIEELAVKHKTELNETELILKNLEITKASQKFNFLFMVALLVVLIGGLSAYFLMDRNKKLRVLYNKNIELLKIFKNENPVGLMDFDSDSNQKLLPIFNQLKKIILEEELFRDANLSISMLSDRLNSNDKYISSAINQFTGMNFNYLINTYRINEVKSLIIKQGDLLNLNEVMYAVGFVNRSTFYKVFLKHTGLSPKQFRLMVLDQDNLE